MTVEYRKVSADGKSLGPKMWAYPTVDDALNVLLDDAEYIVRSGDKSYMFEVRKYREMLKLLHSKPRGQG